MSKRPLTLFILLAAVLIYLHLHDAAARPQDERASSRKGGPPVLPPVPRGLTRQQVFVPIGPTPAGRGDTFAGFGMN